MARRTAEIAGAGLAGLTLATRLAQLGWDVRLHERNPEPRMHGAGIWLRESGLRTPGQLGAFAQAIRTSSVVTGISPAGRMDFADGRRSSADLAVAADGAYSRLREAILCTSWMDFGSQAGIRMLIDRQAGFCPDPLTVLRAKTLRQISRSSWFDRNLNHGPRFEPMGAASPATPR
jgi:2-polyprenyl-6-methoxyphenol hydroxylase-like FAD-dependent oxidoreductase